jgi:hypothetical protein
MLVFADYSVFHSQQINYFPFPRGCTYLLSRMTIRDEPAIGTHKQGQNIFLLLWHAFLGLQTKRQDERFSLADYYYYCNIKQFCTAGVDVQLGWVGE